MLWHIRQRMIQECSGNISSMNSDWLQRGELLLGTERQARLQKAHVLVVGLGGVGSWAAEMLCRAGVGALTVIDADTVDVTNINRQMPALCSTVGLPKCDVVANRLAEINPSLKLIVKNIFLLPDNVSAVLSEFKYDFVVDAIDTLPSKAALIKECWTRGVPVVSSMGAGAKNDLSQIRTLDLWKTEHCTLAKNLRRMLREWRGQYKLPVVFSKQQPDAAAIRQNPDGGKPVIGSAGYVTATFGCYLAEYVINNI